MIGEDESQTIALPYRVRSESRRFELTHASGRLLSGSYVDSATHNRFEVRVEYYDGTMHWFSVVANLPYSGGSIDLSEKNCNFKIHLEGDFDAVHFEFKREPSLNFTVAGNSLVSGSKRGDNVSLFHNIILFDVSDLVYYIGHHDNLTGIQRVQACVLMGLIQSCPEQPRGYITFNNKSRDFLTVDPTYFEMLLQDLSLPVAARRVPYDRMDARLGILPNSQSIATELSSAQGNRLIVYLLGAAWVNRDYFHRILDLKRTYGALFCMTVHDLIPIFARDTCDQGTAIVFEEFLRKSFLFTDHYFTVSEHTALDLHKFAASIEVKNLSLSVVENGHALDEFFPFKGRKARSPIQSEYVLFVSTIEGRKNHSYIFDVWAKLAAAIPSLPVLVCVGRFGWRAEQFLEKMLVSNNLNNKVRVMSDVSDAQLEALYENCLFTVYPSFYEGWGLPVGESLCKGKVCVSSDRSSLPEVAGEFGLYVDIESVNDGVGKIGRLIEDRQYRVGLEDRLQREFRPRTWKKVAQELVTYMAKLPNSRSEYFPLTRLGREYKLAQLPPRNFSALGYAMIAEVAGARKASITGYINRDEDLLAAQAMREGSTWYSPEDWGTWSRYPDCAKLFYIQTTANTTEVVLYEKLRVIAPLVGHSLRVTVNNGSPQDFLIEEEKFIIRIVGQIRADPSGVAEVRIRFELRNSPDILPELEKIDGRRLGLGFESAAIIDDSDLNARISMLERLLFGGSVGKILGQGASNSTMSIEAVSHKGGKRKDARSLLVKSQAGLRIVDGGDQRSLSSPVIAVGERVIFGSEERTAAGDPVDKLLGRGWFPLEQAGVWSKGSEATIHFRLNQSVKAVFVITAELRCLATHDKVVRIAIIINNVVVGTEEYRDLNYRKLHFVVDQQICPDDRAFVALIHCDRPSSPSEFGVSTDGRELGVHIKSFSADPLPELVLDKTYDVDSECAILGAFSDGWHEVESAGLWSQEDGGRIVGALKLTNTNVQSNVRVSIVGRVFGTALTGPAVVDLLVQGQITASWIFDDDVQNFRQAILPLIGLEDCSLLDVRIIRRGSVSPSETEGSEDRRKLGFLISQISFENAILSELPNAS